jgi:hypothetical protein
MLQWLGGEGSDLRSSHSGEWGILDIGVLEKLNETEPFPPEFDEILAQRLNFARVLEL